MAIRFARRVRPLLVIAARWSALLVAAPSLAVAPHRRARAHRRARSRSSCGQLALQNSQLVEKYDQAQVAVRKRDKQAAAPRRSARARRARPTRAAHRRVRPDHPGAVREPVLRRGRRAARQQQRHATTSTASTRWTWSRRTPRRSSERQRAHATPAEAASTKARPAAGRRQARSATRSAKKQRDVADADRQVQEPARHAELGPAGVATSSAANPQVAATTVEQHLHRAPAPAPPAGAVQFALDQVGKPYVFGAAGPGAYDCSGLTMAAWQRGRRQPAALGRRPVRLRPPRVARRSCSPAT